MLEDPGGLECVLACFPSLKSVRVNENFLPQRAVEDALQRLAPHLLPPSAPAAAAAAAAASSSSNSISSMTAQRRHPLLALPSTNSNSNSHRQPGLWSCAASPSSSPPFARPSPRGIGAEEGGTPEEEERGWTMALASPAPLPPLNRSTGGPAAAPVAAADAAASSGKKPAGPPFAAASPCYTPSPATAHAGRGLASLTSGATTPPRSSSAGAAAAFFATAASASSSSSGKKWEKKTATSTQRLRFP